MILPHAGAVEAAAGLILLLADTTGGKSTLALTLAAYRWQLFADDRLGLSRDREASIGIALGLAPKLRLPLPQSAPRLAEFAAERASRRELALTYLALGPEEQAGAGTRAAVAACLLLERDGSKPLLEPVAPSQLVRILGRERGRTLAVRVGRSGCGGLACRSTVLSTALCGGGSGRLAGYGSVRGARRAEAALMRYSRRNGVTQTPVGDDLFLVDLATGEIFHLDRSAGGLWTLLEQPSDFAGILATFGAAFPEAPRDQLELDLRSALATLMSMGLVITGP